MDGVPFDQGRSATASLVSVQNCPKTSGHFDHFQLKMSKRARTTGGSITGGTGDVKPQILTVSSGIAGFIDDYVVNQVNLPVSRFGATKTKTTVIEMLSIDWFLNLRDMADVSGGNFAFLTTVSSRSSGDTSTAASAEADASDPLVFGFCAQFNTLSTNGSSARIFPITVNLTDSNGNGVLIATDRIFVVGGNIAATTAGSYIAKILYRTVNIGIQEYVGIVQSQQG